MHRTIRRSARASNLGTVHTDGMVTIPGGYLDLQVNGGWGHHFSDDPSTIWEVGERMVEHGVTQFLPTLISDGFDRRKEAAAVLRAGPPIGWTGAQPIGLHLEGPWLALSRAGAHDPRALRAIDLGDADTPAEVAMVTIAPEIDGAIDMIRALVDRNIVVSLGHSDAPLRCAAEAIEVGATMGTHLFNAMSGLEHRSPGLAAALLLDERVRFGIIADGFHVDPAMVRLAWQAASDRLVLVSDAVALLGVTADPVARLRNGTLAGATVGIDEAVRNVVRFCNADLGEAAEAAAARPRAVLGLDPPPDTYTELDDQGFVCLTVIDGKTLYRR